MGVVAVDAPRLEHPLGVAVLARPADVVHDLVVAVLHDRPPDAVADLVERLIPGDRRRWFEHYSSLFDTVELNSTFYRLPTPETVETWAAAASSDFVYAVKLGAFGSHRMKLRDAASWMPNHLDRVTRLGAHLGPTLVQLPPRWKRDTARLDEFLSVAPTSMRWAVELRDPSWIHDDVFDVLRRRGAALCLHDLLPDLPFELTTDWTYVRFHGPDALREPYHGAYGEDRLRPWAERLASVIDRRMDVYAYFNNDWYGHAVTDATLLRTLRRLRGLTGEVVAREGSTGGRSCPDTELVSRGQDKAERCTRSSRIAWFERWRSSSVR